MQWGKLVFDQRSLCIWMTLIFLLQERAGSESIWICFFDFNLCFPLLLLRGCCCCCCCCCSVAKSCVTLCNPCTAAHQVSLSVTISQSLLKFMAIELVMPSNHLILCRPLLLLPSIFPSISLFQWVGSLHQGAQRLELQYDRIFISQP